MKVAIIGGGPAGGALAWYLAGAGIDATVFDDSHPREKPCGGGITDRGWRDFPLLETLDLPRVDVSTSTYIPLSGRAATVRGHDPIRVVDRTRLDAAVLDAAVNRGAIRRRERVRAIAREDGRWQIAGDAFDLLVGADGHNGITRRKLARPLAPTDRMLCVGYFIPGEFPPEIVVEFFPDFRGYAWFFPRTDHVSVGVGDCEGTGAKADLYERLHAFLARRAPGAELTGAKRFGGICPGIKGPFADYPYTGDGWALVGDAGGFCDPLTGEGLYYAFCSARLLAESIAGADSVAGSIAAYRAWADRDLVPELEKAGKYQGFFFGRRFLEVAFWAVRRSRSANHLAAEYIAGRQGLIGLKDTTIRLSPRVLTEILTGRRAR